jgi:hypothetical protein
MPRGEPDGVPDPKRVAASLRAVLAAVDAGEVVADDAQRAYLAGAAEAVESLDRAQAGGHSPGPDLSPGADLR